MLRGWPLPVYCAIGAALTAAYFAIPGGPVQTHVIYQAIGLWGIAGMVVGVRTYRPAGLAWPLVLAGLTLWVAGDGYWNAYRLVTGSEAPFPSPADALYLLA